jgi:hypothetical protein
MEARSAFSGAASPATVPAPVGASEDATVESDTEFAPLVAPTHVSGTNGTSTDHPVPRPVAIDDLRFAPPEIGRAPVGGADSRGGVAGPWRDLSSIPDPLPPVPQRPLFSDVEVPLDGTLQFLPGRLEVIQGTEPGHEFRFVRDYRAIRTEITFGRSDGPPNRHVKLSQPTVSRLHARVIVDGTTWLLANLSTTNPVIVNGQPLADVDAPVVLHDGDRIEMGEVAFLFRER